jgi:hypothetical protein
VEWDLPVFGGWIADPHFMYTPVFEFPAPVRDQLHATIARYQGFDVNPWFRDATSEVLLALELDGIPHAFPIASPPSPPGRAYAFYDADLVVIEDDTSLLWFTALRGENACFIEIPLPLDNASAGTHCEGSEGWARILEKLRRRAYTPPEERICGSLNVNYWAFYEHFGSCGAWKREQVQKRGK